MLLEKYQEMGIFDDILLTHFEQPGIDEDTPLHIAAFLGRIKDVEFMLKYINIKGDIGNTPLHYAVLKNHKKIIKLLLDKGANSMIYNDYCDLPERKESV